MLAIIREIASATMTMPRYEVPLRWNGAYTTRFSRNEKTAPKMPPAIMPIQIETPALFKE